MAMEGNGGIWTAMEINEGQRKATAGKEKQEKAALAAQAGDPAPPSGARLASKPWHPR